MEQARIETMANTTEGLVNEAMITNYKERKRLVWLEMMEKALDELQIYIEREKKPACMGQWPMGKERGIKFQTLLL